MLVNVRRLLPTALASLVAVLACWVAFRIAVTALNSTVSFDGAMNLQVSASVAEGTGYRRSYAEQPVFPHEVETNYPYTLLAAGIFWIGGVGIRSAALPNLIYLLGLITTIYLVVRRAAPSSWPGWALAGILVCLSVQEFPRFAGGGYGEIPALFWFVAGCCVLFSPKRGPRLTWPRVLGSGVLIGLAVATKTVLLIGFGAAGLTLLISTLTDERRVAPAIRHGAIFLAGGMLALLPFEIWRLWSLHGVEAYCSWWGVQFGQVALQAGVKAGFHDTTGLGAKLASHFRILARSLSLSEPQLLLLLCAEVLAILWALRVARDRSRWLLTAVALGAAIYFVWWLFITPSQKAWLRRILDGVLLLHIAAAAGLAIVDSAAQKSPLRPAVGRMCFALGLIVIICVANPIWKAVLEAPRFKPDLKNEQILAVADWVRQAPASAVLSGEGWYSAPALSLYSARPLININNWSPDHFRDHGVIYAAVDLYGIAARSFSHLRASYATRNLFPGFVGATIYEIDLSHPIDVFAKSNSQPLASQFDFATGTYAHLFGFNPEAQPWRWIRCEAETLLSYPPEADELFISFLANRPSDYLHPGGCEVTIEINGREVLRQNVAGTEAGELRYPTAGLGLSANSAVRVRIKCNNVLHARFDGRQLAIRIRAMGFRQSQVPTPP